MPTITGLKEQQQAFHDISCYLKELELVNRFLEKISKETDNIYYINATSLMALKEDESAEEEMKNQRKKKKPAIYIPMYEPDIEKIKSMVLEYKKHQKKIIEDLAIQYHIAFDNNDLKILNMYLEMEG